MVDILKWLARFLPLDSSNRAGYGFFRLPDDCEWMQSIFEYHDHYYVEGPKIGMRLSDIDWRIFKALTIAAEVPDDPMERCHRASQICLYWSIMRKAGHYLYGRDQDA